MFSEPDIPVCFDIITVQACSTYCVERATSAKFGIVNVIICRLLNCTGKGKGKGKVHPITGHESPDGE